MNRLKSSSKWTFLFPTHAPFCTPSLSARKSNPFFLKQKSAQNLPVPNTILAKLEWYHLGGEVSERQWRDILGVLKTRAGALDLSYLRNWADELEVTNLLERALKETE